MPCEGLLAICRLPSGRNAYETNDASVRTSLNHRELAKILVEGYEYSWLKAMRAGFEPPQTHASRRSLT